MKKIVSLALVIIICLFSFTSCLAFDVARRCEESTRAFFSCIENDDYTKAVTYLHPASNIPRIELKSAITDFESDLGIDFSDEVIFDSLYEMSTTVYPYTEHGRADVCVLTFVVFVGETEAFMDVGYIEDDRGAGIYDLYLYLTKGGTLGGQ